MFKHTLSSASSTYDLTATTACQPIPLSYGINVPTSDTNLGDQIASVDVIASATGAAGTIALILTDPNSADTKVRIVEATVTATAQRAVNTGGASGGYVCTVAFADGTNKVDLNGGSKNGPTTVTSAGAQAVLPLPVRWFVGCSSLGGLSSLTVCVSTTRCV